MGVTTNSEKLRFLTVAGPDKLALTSFTQWSVQALGNSFETTGSMHNLMSSEASEAFVKDFTSKFNKGLITYYAKKVINHTDPVVIIPRSLYDVSDIILWFELYATDPKVLKTIDEKTSKVIMDAWKIFVEKGGFGSSL